MEKKIKIKAGAVEAAAILNDSATAQKIWASLPIETRASTWGDEIYFAIPVKAPLEKNAQELVEVGDLGYWPSGNAFCIFFGPTPMSRGQCHRASLRRRQSIQEGSVGVEGPHRSGRRLKRSLLFGPHFCYNF
jgi:uncharacterized protein